MTSSEVETLENGDIITIDVTIGIDKDIDLPTGECIVIKTFKHGTTHAVHVRLLERLPEQRIQSILKNPTNTSLRTVLKERDIRYTAGEWFVVNHQISKTGRSIFDKRLTMQAEELGMGYREEE